MEQMLIKIRKLNWLLQRSGEGTIRFNELCEILSDLMLSNVYAVGRRGKILGVHYKVKKDTAAQIDPKTGKQYIPAETNKRLMEITETQMNLTGTEAMEVFQYDGSAYNKFNMLVPVFGGGRRLGTLIFSRYDKEYETGDVILGEYSATVVGIDIERRQNREIETEVRKKAVVQLAIGTLSYTEIDAVQQIFAELPEEEGLVIAGKISDRTGIARTVILNGLKKLENTGVIESRSLGMKGTHIRIINDQLKPELARISL